MPVNQYTVKSALYNQSRDGESDVANFTRQSSGKLPQNPQGVRQVANITMLGTKTNDYGQKNTKLRDRTTGTQAHEVTTQTDGIHVGEPLSAHSNRHA